jgi:hypothetical protein
VFVENVNLIVAGVIVIITSLGPYTLFLHRINNHLHHYWMNWDAQTNHELDHVREPSLGTPFPELPYSITVQEGTEMFPNRQIEFLIVRAGDVPRRNDHEIEVLIDGLNKRDLQIPDQKLSPKGCEQLPPTYSEFLSADNRENVFREVILHDTQSAGEQLQSEKIGHTKYPHSPYFALEISLEQTF